MDNEEQVYLSEDINGEPCQLTALTGEDMYSRLEATCV